MEGGRDSVQESAGASEKQWPQRRGVTGDGIWEVQGDKAVPRRVIASRKGCVCVLRGANANLESLSCRGNTPSPQE